MTFAGNAISHVLICDWAYGALRLALSAGDTTEDVEEILRAVRETVFYLRNKSLRKENIPAKANE
jgi:hypothetical protein